MTATTWPITPTGTLGEARQDDDLGAASSWLPDGPYTTLRSYGGSGLLRLASHLDRLEETARLLGQPLQLPRDGLRRALCVALRRVPWAGTHESRLRLTVGLDRPAGALWLSVEPLPLPAAALYEQGVAVVTRVMQRDNPKAKNSAFLAASAQARAALGGRINEVLMVGAAGAVLEGLSSNFFALLGGTLYTAEEGVLPGITRALILEEAEGAGVLVQRTALPLAALPLLEEAFVSSTSRAVLPVVEIDGRVVGSGQPGPLTQRLAARYAARLEREVESVCADE